MQAVGSIQAGRLAKRNRDGAVAALLDEIEAVIEELAEADQEIVELAAAEHAGVRNMYGSIQIGVGTDIVRHRRRPVRRPDSCWRSMS